MELTNRELELVEFGNSLRGAEVYFREDWGCYYFSLLGKAFGMLNDNRITLKGNPNRNIQLRLKYEDITPGYHTNKVHWNSIVIDSEILTVADMKEFILESYSLVYAKLTRKDKEIVDDMPLR